MRKDNDNWIDVLNGTSYSYSGLTNGANYTFYVRAVNIVGESAATSTIVDWNVNKDTNATLKQLAVSDGTLTPTFAPATADYTVTVANSVSSITLTATANHANATVSGDGAKSLSVGENKFEIKVTAEDGVTVMTYTVTVTREQEKNGDAEDSPGQEATDNSSEKEDSTISPDGNKVSDKDKYVTKPSTLKVTFNADDGKTKIVKDVKKGTKIGKLKVPTRKGCTFKGWYTKKIGGKKINSNTKITKSITLYARWQKKVRYGKVVKVAAVYVRKSPFLHINLDPVVGYLKKGQTFKIQGFLDNPGTRNDWYIFKYKNKVRYVYAKYVEIVWI